MPVYLAGDMLMLKKIFTSMKRQEGFTLFELLLVVGVSSVLVVGAVRLTGDWAQQIADQQEARYLQTVMNAANTFVTTNFAAIWSAGMGENFIDNNADTFCCNAGDTLNFGRVIRVDINFPAGPGLLYSLKTPFSGSLDAGFPNLTPLRFAPEIYIRNLGYVGETRTFEIFVMTNSAGGALLPLNRANNVARLIGPEGAVVSRINYGTKTIYAGAFCDFGNVIDSKFGTWQITMDLLNTPGTFALDAANAYCPAVQPGLNGQGGYVALRRVVKFEEANLDDVLYRVAIPGNPDANRMQANLDMNGRNILRTDAVSADRLLVTGNVNIANGSSTIFIEENARFTDNGGLGSGIRPNPIPGGASPDSACGWDPLNPNQLDPAVVGTCDLRGGNLTISPTGASGDALIVNSLNAADSSVSANRLIVGGSLDVGENIDISGTAQITDGTVNGVATNTVTVNGALSSTLIQSTNLTNTTAMTSGHMIAGSVGVNGTLTADNLDVVQTSGGSQGVYQASGAMNITGGLTANQVAVTNLTACQATVIHRFNYLPSGGANKLTYYDSGDFEPGVPSYDCVVGP